MKKIYVPDPALTVDEYMERHAPTLADVPEADVYLRMRYQWMKQQVSYIPVRQAFEAYEERIALSKKPRP